MQYTLQPPHLQSASLTEPIAALCRLVGDGRALPEKYLAPLRAVESWLVNLPAAQSYYAEENGAVAYALVTSTNAVRIASNSIFAPTAANELRAQLQPQYEYAAFLAGLSCVLAFPSREVRVVSPDKPAWNCLLGPLRTYLAPGDGYSVTWLQRATRVPSASHGAWVGSIALLPFAQQYIADLDVTRDFVSAIMPDAQPTAGESLLVQIVRRACLKTVADYKTALAESTVLPSRATPAAEERAESVRASSPTAARTPTAQAAPAYSTSPPPQNAALSALQSTIASVRMTGTVAQTPAKTPITTPKPVAPLTDDSSADQSLIGKFIPWAREFFQSLRDDVEARDPIIQKMKIDESGRGFVLLRQMITRRGLDDNKVAEYLHSQGLLVEKLAATLIVDPRMGAYITQDGEYTVGAQEKPAGAR